MRLSKKKGGACSAAWSRRPARPPFQTNFGSVVDEVVALPEAP
jgi:hypothetical protein